MNNEQTQSQPESDIATKLAEVEKTSGIATDSALALRGQFSGYYGQIELLCEQAAAVTNPEDATQQKIARTVRLGLRKVRCEVENVRKALKADSLARGKAIDGYANVLKYLCEPTENRLLEIEQHAERVEAARVAQLVADRTAKLQKVDADPSIYNLAAMDEETFDAALESAWIKQQQRIEAEKKAETERIAKEKADAEERDRMRKENERLKAEAEAREKALDAERAEREKAEAKAKAEAESERKRIEAERSKERAELEAKAKAEAEARAKAEREAAESRRKIEAEKQQAERMKAEQAKKEADEKHRKAKMNEAYKSLVAAGFDNDIAVRFVLAVSKCEVANMKMVW